MYETGEHSEFVHAKHFRSVARVRLSLVREPAVELAPTICRVPENAARLIHPLLIGEPQESLGGQSNVNCVVHAREIKGRSLAASGVVLAATPAGAPVAYRLLVRV